MKVGDLVKMGFDTQTGDVWGMGVIVEVLPDVGPDDVCVLWSTHGTESWEMKTMLEVVDESG